MSANEMFDTLEFILDLEKNGHRVHSAAPRPALQSATSLDLIERAVDRVLARQPAISA